MTVLSSLFARWATVLVLVLAFVASAAGHRAPDADRLAYELAGGALSDLCGDDGEMLPGDACPVCTLSASLLLPKPPTLPLPAGHWQPADLAQTDSFPVLPHGRDPAHGVRAPPRA
ncbi:hypothetical protein [Gemmobacter denitrificans]|uniref:DUF2946 family protein n=1 Tax=Gemmobacter denitrificans TaxID=3123040 RepID=A0ABU8BV10_9RHOB